MTKTAHIYGGSLYDLAAEEHKTGELLTQMEMVRKLFRENPDYMNLLSEPSIPIGDRRKLIEDAFGASVDRYLVNLMKLMCDRGILREFPGCCVEFKKRYNADNQIAEAVVTSAVPLTEDQAEALTRRLQAMSGKKISLIQKLDPKVVAGLRVNLEGMLLDGTVQGRLDSLTRQLEEIII